jgi:hypothetical protein
MKFKKPLLFIAALVASFLIASALTTVSKPSNYSESYPAVVCPPTLNGLTSQISISSRKTQYQRLENRSSKTLPFNVLRFPVSKDSLVITAEGTTPLIWQSRAGSWAGGTLCSGPSAAAWFVGGTANVTTRGRLMLINSGLSDAIVDIQSYTENAKQPIKSVNLKSKSYMQLSIDSLAPGDKALAVQVIPRSGRVNAYMIDEQGAGLKALGGDFVNSYPTAAKELVIPAIPNQLPSNSYTRRCEYNIYARGFICRWQLCSSWFKFTIYRSWRCHRIFFSTKNLGKRLCGSYYFCRTSCGIHFIISNYWWA